MPKPTIAQTLAKGLIRMGCQEIASTSKKYRMFLQRSQGRVFLVGKAGSLRINTRTVVTGSAACLDNFKRLVLQKGSEDETT